jgi:hypothetical protein
VDYERVCVKLRAEIASKASHGRSALLQRFAEIEAECELPEGQDLYDDRPLPRRPAATRAEHDGDDTEEYGAASHAERAIA